jgi:hypothetical protein
MNRIILIGNGFDLAHGLKTSYRDFIDDFWERQIARIKEERDDRGGAFFYVENEVVRISYEKTNNPYYREGDIDIIINDEYSSGEYLKTELESKDVKLGIKNHFLRQITKQKYIKNWVDIENEYFKLLAKCYADNEKIGVKASYTIKELNEEFEYVRQEFINYLDRKNEKGEKNISIPISIIEGSPEYGICYKMFDCVYVSDLTRDGLDAHFEEYCAELVRDEDYNDITYSKEKMRKHFNDEVRKAERGINIPIDKPLYPREVCFLSLNYTNTEKMYQVYKRLHDNIDEPEWRNTMTKVIHIHGELDRPSNPVIFGFGDENCKDYEEIEDLNNNDYLEYFKTTMYSNTSNYRDFLNFIDADKYQVFIMGASCGVSDKTLLKTMFEHENCVSIKYFYYKRDDGTDDYSDIIKNISRCFSDKAMMRAKVVNKKYCKPLKDT